MMIEKVFLHTSQCGRHGSPARDCVRFDFFRYAVSLMHYNSVICASDWFLRRCSISYQRSLCESM